MTRQTEKPDRPSEEAAHEVTVTGWACKHCNRFWGDDERMARFCCATSMPCECGVRMERHYTACKDCIEKRRDESFAKLAAQEWDGETPLYSESDDQYFMRTDELSDYLAHGADDAGGPGPYRDAADCIQQLRLRICDENKPHHFDANDYWCDDLGEDQELPDARTVEDLVNEWIEAQRPLSWSPGSFKPTPESLAKYVSIPIAQTETN